MEKKKEIKKRVPKAKAVAPKKETVKGSLVSEPKSVNVEVEMPKKEVVKEETIFDKYRKYINTVKDGYLRDINYADAMEMLRYIEKNRNIKLGLNMTCAACMIELVGMFSRLEKV